MGDVVFGLFFKLLLNTQLLLSLIMRDKAIIFIGFRHKVDSVYAAKKAGYKVILLTRQTIPKAVPHFDEIFEEDILDVEVLKKLIPQIRKKYIVKGVVSNYEQFVVQRSFFAERFGIPTCSVYSACCTRNKAMQRHALAFMKENIDYSVVKNLRQALSSLKKLDGKVFLKSIAGIKSRLVFPINSPEQMKEAFSIIKSTKENIDQDLYDDYEYCDFNFKYPSPKENFIIEKAEYGQQITVASLIGNHKIWHAPSICDVYTAASLGRDDTFLAFRILPSKMSKDIKLKAKTATQTASRILGLKNCSVHAEFILRDDGEVKLIELASRMGGYRSQMYKEAYGIELNQMLIQAVIGKDVKTRKKAEKFVSVMEIFAQEEGPLKEIKNLEKLEKDPQVKNIKKTVKEGVRVGLAKNGFKSVLTFLIVGDSYEEVENKSREYQDLLKVMVS